MPPRPRQYRRANEALAPIIHQVFQIYSHILSEEPSCHGIRSPGSRLTANPAHTTKVMRTPRSITSPGGRSWSASLSTYLPCSVMMQQRWNIFTSVTGWRSPTGFQSSSLCIGSRSLTQCLDNVTKLTKAVKPFDDVNFTSHMPRMVQRKLQDQYEFPEWQCPRANRTFWKCSNTLKRPSWLNRNAMEVMEAWRRETSQEDKKVC